MNKKYSQNPQIAESIIEKQNNAKSQNFLFSLAAEELEEYLLYLMYENHIPALDKDKKMYDLNVTHFLRYTRTSSREGTEDAVFDTLQAVRGLETPQLKRTFSEAASNLLRKNVDDDLFVEVLFRSLGYFSDLSQEQGLVAFDFDALRLAVESKSTSIMTKVRAIHIMNELVGSDKPSLKIIFDLMIDYRDRFKREDRILLAIFDVLRKNHYYTEAVQTLTFLSDNSVDPTELDELEENQEEEQATDAVINLEYFEKDLANVFQPHRYNNRYDVSIDKVIHETLDRLADPVRAVVVKVLKNHSVSTEEFEIATAIVRLNFPVTPKQKELIFKL